MLKVVSKSLDNPPERAAQLKSGAKHQKNYQNQSGQNQSCRQAKLQQFHGSCGSSEHTSNCPKAKLHCNRCNRAGHTGYVCLNSQPKTGLQHPLRQQSRQPSPIHSPNHSQSPEHQHRASVLTVVKKTTSENEALPKLWLCFSQDKIFHNMATCDTGAIVIVISLDIQCYKLHVQDTSECLLMADGNQMTITGRIFLTVKLPCKQDRSTTIKALVSLALHEEILLPLKDQISLGLLPENFPNHVKVCTSSLKERDSSSDFESMKSEVSDIFSDDLSTLSNKSLGGKMMIHLRNDIPIKQRQATVTWQIPIHLQDSADKVVQDLLDAGIIIPVHEPTEWTSQGHFVVKPDGSARLVTDHTQLNKVVKHLVHPFPSSQDIIQSVCPDSRVFATFNCKFGYHKVKLDHHSSLLKTFLIPQGHFQYTRAPMGLNTSGDEFCRHSDKVIHGIPDIWKLVDDIFLQALDMTILLQCKQ